MVSFKVRVFLSVMAFFFGCFVLFVSLLTASGVLTFSGPQAASLYVDGVLMPNHPLYPFVMARDRFELGWAGADEQVLLRIEYAQRRYESAKKLLETGGSEELALTTLSKSQKYLIEAVHQSRQLEVSSQTKAKLVVAMTEHIAALKLLMPQLKTVDTSHISTLITEEQALLAEISY